jgi:hypothetical protein
MKKFLLALGVVAALSLLFVGCDKPTDEPAGGGSEATGETVVATGVHGTFFKWSDYSITADNAADYIVRVTYTLDDASKAGWGPGAFNDAAYANNSLADKLNVSAAGVNEIPVSEVIAVAALKDGFMINWWGDYATLKKVEIIKIK